jgi:hypothetical protein
VRRSPLPVLVQQFPVNLRRCFADGGGRVRLTILLHFGEYASPTGGMPRAKTPAIQFSARADKSESENVAAQLVWPPAEENGSVCNSDVCPTAAGAPHMAALNQHAKYPERTKAVTRTLRAASATSSILCASDVRSRRCPVAWSGAFAGSPATSRPRAVVQTLSAKSAISRFDFRT